MSTRIVYSQGTQTGRMLAQAVGATMSSVQQMRRVKALLDAASNGASWDKVALEVGGGITAQDAQNLWTIVSTALAAIDVPQVAEMARLDQG